MHIPPRFQPFLNDEQETEQRLRKGRAWSKHAYSPIQRRNVYLAGKTEASKLQRTVQRNKISINTDESLDELRHLAYDRHHLRGSLRGETIAPINKLHPSNLDRITVNFIRHTRTTYDHKLDQHRFSTGKRNSAFSSKIKVGVLAEIAERFPELEDECERQTLVISNDLEIAVARVRSMAIAA